MKALHTGYQTTSRRKKWILYACMLLVAFLMAGASGLFGEKDIIFPEIMAIAAGSILSPDYAWQTSKKRLLLCITVCAVCGLLLELFCPGPITVKLVLAFLGAQIIFLLSRTSFAPMVSAMAMPAFLEIGSVVYLISAVVFTALILGINLFLEHAGLKTDPGFTPLTIETRDVTNVLKRTIIMIPVILLVFFLDIRFAVAPPMLVAFILFTNPAALCRKKPVRFIALLFFCALAGSMSRLLFTEFLHWPLVVSVLIAFFFIDLVMDRTKLYFPPAAALAMLAFLVPVKTLPVFSLNILIGSILLMICGMLFFRPKKQRTTD